MNNFNHLSRAELTFFVFHNPPAAGHEKITTRGVDLDHGAIDYQLVLKHFAEMAKGYHPGSRILYVTGLNGFPIQDAETVRIDMAGTEPMYDRVRAMHEYVHSSAFGPTAFLDSDAFVNGDLSRLFTMADFCLTVREDPQLPVNEGVIISSGSPLAHRFFDKYFEHYEKLPVEFRRWGGGQRSLNELAKDPEFSRSIKFLDADTFNFTPVPGREYSGADFAQKLIIHVKGNRKASAVTLGGIMRFQKALLAQWQANG